jgi:hypothetical protein
VPVCGAECETGGSNWVREPVPVSTFACTLAVHYPKPLHYYSTKVLSYTCTVRCPDPRLIAVLGLRAMRKFAK